MSKYAKINSSNIVENVIVCEDSQIGSFPGEWIKVTAETKEAHVGGEYNRENSKFISVKPQFDSWVLDEDFNWVAPTEMPLSGNYIWNESLAQWEEYEPDNTAPQE